MNGKEIVEVFWDRHFRSDMEGLHSLEYLERDIDAAIQAEREACAKKDKRIEELEKIEQFATHSGLLKAQEEHNRMIADRDAKISELELAVRAAESAESVLSRRISELEEDLQQARNALAVEH